MLQHWKQVFKQLIAGDSLRKREHLLVSACLTHHPAPQSQRLTWPCQRWFQAINAVQGHLTNREAFQPSPLLQLAPSGDLYRAQHRFAGRHSMQRPAWYLARCWPRLQKLARHVEHCAGLVG